MGLAGQRDQVAELADELRSACGAGGTVKDGVLELQGDQAAGGGVPRARGFKSS